MKRSELIEIIRRVVQEKKRTDESKIVPASIIGRYWASEDDLPKDIKIDWDWDWSDEYEELDGDSIIVYGNVYGKDQHGNIYKASVKATKDLFLRSGDPDEFYYYDIKLEPSNKTNEARITPVGIGGRILPQADIDDIDILTESFGEGDSGFDLYEPISEGYSLRNYCGDEEGDEEGDYDDYDDYDNDYDKKCRAIRILLKKHPIKTTFVSNDIIGGALYDFSCPGAPPGSFGSCIQIDPKNKRIDVYIPYPDNKGRYSVGWFDLRGNYFPDTKNFDEDGNYIGGA